MIYVKNKKYELIEIRMDGEANLLDVFCGDLCVYSCSEKEEFSEEFRIESNISEVDFYSEKLYKSKEILNEKESLAFIANYSYNSDKRIKELFNENKKLVVIKEFFLDGSLFSGHTSIGKKKEDSVIKYKPAPCLYKYGIIEKYIEFIYSVFIGESFIFFGEYK